MVRLVRVAESLDLGSRDVGRNAKLGALVSVAGLVGVIMSLGAYVAAGALSAADSGAPHPLGSLLMTVSIVASVVALSTLAFGAAVLLVAGVLALIRRPWRPDAAVGSRAPHPEPERPR
jgi:hypothetical protein